MSIFSHRTSELYLRHHSHCMRGIDSVILEINILANSAPWGRGRINQISDKRGINMDFLLFIALKIGEEIRILGKIFTPG